MEAVTTRERENFMKNKKISKVVLSVLTSMSMLSSYSATIFAETPSQETGVAHEHDLIELERKSDLITNGGFDNNGGSWKKTGTGTFGESDGNYYGKLSSNSNNAAVYQVVSFKKNTDYVVKGKVKISNAKGQVFLAVKNGQLSAGLKDNNGKTIETTISSSEDKSRSISRYRIYFLIQVIILLDLLLLLNGQKKMVTKILFKKKCGSMMYPLKK